MTSQDIITIKKYKKEEQKEDKVNLTKQIDTLVLVIENLGLLNKEKIIEKLDKLPVEYDKNLVLSDLTRECRSSV